MESQQQAGVKELTPNPAPQQQTPPNNNEKQPPQPETPQAPEQGPPVAEKFEISGVDLQELISCIDEVVKGKWSKSSIFNCMNSVLIPIGKDGKPIQKPLQKTASDKQ